MTGYGRFEATKNGMDITVEVKSVNHRYYEFSSRTPRAYGFLDEKLKSYIQQSLSRGKVEASVWIETVDSPASQVRVDHTLAMGYMKAYLELEERYGLKYDRYEGEGGSTAEGGYPFPPGHDFKGGGTGRRALSPDGARTYGESGGADARSAQYRYRG